MGNAAFVAGQYEKAIKHFTEAIKNDPSNAILYRFKFDVGNC